MKARGIVLGSALLLAALSAWWVSREEPLLVDSDVVESSRSAPARSPEGNALPTGLISTLKAPRLTAEPKGIPFGEVAAAPVTPLSPDAPPPVADPGPPPFPYTYLGRLDVPGERTRIVLSRGADLRQVPEGDPVDSLFSLKGIGASGLVIEHRPDGRTWLIPYAKAGQMQLPGESSMLLPAVAGPSAGAAVSSNPDVATPVQTAPRNATSERTGLSVPARESPMESETPVPGVAMESTPPVPGTGMGAPPAPDIPMSGLPEHKRRKGS